jgi:hypothetical protein
MQSQSTCYQRGAGIGQADFDLPGQGPGRVVVGGPAATLAMAVGPRKAGKRLRC